MSKITVKRVMKITGATRRTVKNLCAAPKEYTGEAKRLTEQFLRGEFLRAFAIAKDL
jgi:hypothetical protein